CALMAGFFFPYPSDFHNGHLNSYPYGIDSYNGHDQGQYQDHLFNDRDERNHDGYQEESHDERQYRPYRSRRRTPTPPPPPTLPSQEYLAISRSPQPATPIRGQRKLLIFDLNGTLLLRSARGYSPRRIFLRPYARCLAAYLAHPAVQAWLDCMVWSSAQPHNVREMVVKVFGESEGDGKGSILRAVWARDTLGLSRDAYHQKSQTTKDLAKPWEFFAKPQSIRRSSSPSISSSPITDTTCLPANQDTTALGSSSSSHIAEPSFDSDHSSSQSSSSLRPELFPHGPETTFLVDDSPLKARLQQWNHLCVPEYDPDARRRDRIAAGLSPEETPEDNLSSGSTTNGLEKGTGAADSGEIPIMEEISLKKDRWRKRRKHEQAESSDKEESGSSDTSPPEEIVEGATASTAPVPGMSKRAKRRERKRLLLEAEGTSAAPETAQASLKRKRSTEGNEVERGLDGQVAASVVASTSTEEKTAEDHTACDDAAEPFDPTLLAVIGIVSHSRNVGNVASWVRAGGLSSAAEDRKATPYANPAEWFMTRSVLFFWAARGRQALAEFGIEAESGID
ncbi:unnamed protein product, partial [Mycena citricolor]